MRLPGITRPQVRAAITMLELIDILRTFESATRARQLHRGQVYAPYAWEWDTHMDKRMRQRPRHARMPNVCSVRVYS